MKEIKKIIRHYKGVDANIECALATVVFVEGSSYRRVGARMLVMSNGQWEGGISGGCLEGDALRNAQKVIHSRKSKVVTYDTREDAQSQIGVGLGCNGLIDVLITPIDKQADRNPMHVLEECVDQRAEHIIITLIRNDESPETAGYIHSLEEWESFREWNDDDRTRLNDAVRDARLKQRSQVITMDECRILIEYLPPPVHMIVMGGQYDTLPLMELKTFLDWKATLVCKIQTTNYKALALADARLNQRTDYQFPSIDRFTVAILMSHDYQTDKDNLKRLLEETEIQYIGLLGPKKRGDKIRKELNIISEEQLARIYNPVGLDTGATSPEEISISIVAEIRAFFSQRDGKQLKYRSLPIHERTKEDT